MAFLANSASMLGDLASVNFFAGSGRCADEVLIDEPWMPPMRAASALLSSLRRGSIFSICRRASRVFALIALLFRSPGPFAPGAARELGAPWSEVLEV